MYDALLGSIWNGKLKGRLSTEKRYRISELTPETTLSLTTFVWMKLLSNDLVMSGSLVPYDVAVTISLSNPRRSVNFLIANPLDNLFKVLKKYSEQRWSYFHYFHSCLWILVWFKWRLYEAVWNCMKLLAIWNVSIR